MPDTLQGTSDAIRLMRDSPSTLIHPPFRPSFQMPGASHFQPHLCRAVPSASNAPFCHSLPSKPLIDPLRPSSSVLSPPWCLSLTLTSSHPGGFSFWFLYNHWVQSFPPHSELPGGGSQSRPLLSPTTKPGTGLPYPSLSHTSLLPQPGLWRHYSSP